MSKPPAYPPASPSLPSQPPSPQPPCVPVTMPAFVNQPLLPGVAADCSAPTTANTDAADTASGIGLQAASASPADNCDAAASDVDDAKTSASILGTLQEQNREGIVADLHLHHARNETSLSMDPGSDNAAKAASTGLFPTQVGFDAEDCHDVDAAQGGGCATHSAKSLQCKFNDDDSQDGCTLPVIMGKYCNKQYDTLIEEAGLLNNLFYSSAASASSGEENAQGDDAQSNPSLDEHHDSIMDTSTSGNYEMAKGSKKESIEAQHYLPQEEAPIDTKGTGPAAAVTPLKGKEAVERSGPTIRVIGSTFAVAVPRLPQRYRRKKEKPPSYKTHSIESSSQSSQTEITAAVDSVAAAARILMTGSLANSPLTLEVEGSKDLNDASGTDNQTLESVRNEDLKKFKVQREQLSQTTVPQLQTAVAVAPLGPPASPHPVPHPVPSAEPSQQEAAGSTTTMKQLSPLDLLSSVSSTSPWGSDSIDVLHRAMQQQQQPNRTDGNPLPPPSLKRSQNFVSSTNKSSAKQMTKTERSTAPEKKNADPNFAVLATEKRLYENLASLRPCIETGGLIDYAMIEDQDTRNRAKNFVKEKRRSYRRMKDEEQTSLTDERLKLSEEAKLPLVFKSKTKTGKQAASPAGVPAVTPSTIDSSSLDLLCSITAQSFEDTDSWCDDAIDNEETQGSRPHSLPAYPTPTALEFESARLVVQKALLEMEINTLKCKACSVKPNFAGLNENRRRCFNPYCLSKTQEKRLTQEREGAGSKREEGKIMKAELEKIKAELDSKARGVKYGFENKGVIKRRSSKTVENLSMEVDESNSEEVELLDGSSQSEELSNAVYKTAMASDMLDLSLGVTMRSSGKWQVQLYYAGNACYIGLFENSEEAAMAYEMARGCCASFEEKDPSPEQVKRNIYLMREAAFSVVKYRRHYSEELDQYNRPKQSSDMAENDKLERSTAVSVKCPKGDDDAASKAGLLIRESQKNKRMVDITEDTESRKRKFSSDIYQKAKALAESLPRGITVRPSGRWQVQLYYAGKSRYIGVFDSKLDAAVAYELARDCFVSLKYDEPSPEQAKKNVELMRKAAFSFFGDNKRRRATVEDSPAEANGGKSNKTNAPAAEQQPAEGQSQLADKLGNDKLETKNKIEPKKMPEPKENSQPKKKREPKKRELESKLDVKAGVVEGPRKVAEKKTQQVSQIKGAALAKRRAPAAVTIVTTTPARRKPTTKELHEIGPGWKLKIVPKRLGKGSNYYYFSPAGESFRSFKQAMEASANERIAHEKDEVVSGSGRLSSAVSYRESSSADGSSITGSVGTCIGAVGYKFRKKVTDESGENLGWRDGEVVEILSRTDKDRKCLYAADGIENLSLAELKELAELESKPHTKPKLGSVGWKFQKQFPDGKWYNGVVVKILEDSENGNDRRCRYPADDDFEDLSIADLKKLAQLEKKKKKKKKTEEVQHNDLCETCGGVGRLLCCSTCNLVFHLGCTRPKLTKLPEDDWSCAFCIASGDVLKKTSSKEQNKARLAVREIEALKELARKKVESRRKSLRKR